MYTYKQTLKMLTDVVAERGEDFVYYGDPNNPEDGSCYYVKNGQPSCGVGWVLVRVGVDPASLESMPSCGEGGYGDMFAKDALSALAKDGVVAFDDDACALLAEFQWHQDRGVPWGESLRTAVDTVGIK